MSAAALQPVEAGVLDSIKGFFWKEEAPPPSIKILILHDQAGAMIDLKGKYQAYNPHNMERITKSAVGKRQYLTGLTSGIKWGEEFPGVHQLLIVPDDPNTITMIDGKPYKGSLYVYDIGSSISIVNELPIEDYLMAILTPNYNEELPHEALAAIAIAARTQALYNTKNPKNTYWTVDGRKVGYEGLGTVRPGAVAQAINTTKNMVLSKTGIYEGVTPFPAQWGTPTSAKSDEAVPSRITLFDVEAMAKKGSNAAQILAKAFPNSVVILAN